MKNKKRFIIWFGIFLLAAIIGTLSRISHILPQYREIVVTSAISMPLSDSITLSGIVEPYEKQEITINSSDEVKKIYVSEGDYVKKEQMLLELDDTDFNNSIKSETISLTKLERDLGKLIKGYNNTEIDDLDITIEQSQIQYDNMLDEYEAAKKKQEQNKTMYDKGYISKTEYEASVKQVDKLQQDIKIHEMKLKNLKDDISKTNDDKKAKIADLKSSIDLAKSNIAISKDAFNKDVRSNIEGKVVECDVTLGQNYLDAKQTVVIYDLSKYIIELNLKQDDIQGLEKNQKVRVKLEALKREYVATIIDMSNEAMPLANDSKDYYVTVKVSIDEPDENIKVGTEVEVVLDKKVKSNAVAIKFDGIIIDEEDRKYVYIFKDNIATRTFVRTGIETDFYVEITEGLISGDQYIINPPERIQKKRSSRVWRYDIK